MTERAGGMRYRLWQLLHSPVIIVASRLVTLVLGLITTFVIARTLGPSGRGDTAAALAALYLVPIVLALGTQLVVRRRAATTGTGDSIRTLRLFAVLTLPACVVIAGGVVAWPLASLDTATKVATFVGISVCPVTMLWLGDQGILVANNRFLAMAAVQAMLPLFFFVAVVFWSATSWANPATIVLSNVGGSIATLLLSSALVRVRLRGPRDPLRPFVREGLTYTGSQAAEAASNRLDQVYLLPLMGSAQLGLYSIAATIAATPLVFAYAIMARSYGPIARSEGDERRDNQLSAIRSGFYWSFAATVPIAVGAYAAVPVVFGEDFSDARWPTVIAAAGAVALVTATVCSNSLAAENRGAAMSLAQLAGLSTALLLALVLAPEYGATGAAVASSIGYCLTLAWVLFALRVSPLELTPTRSRLRRSIVEMVRG